MQASGFFPARRGRVASAARRRPRARCRRPSRSARSGSPTSCRPDASLAYNESVSLHLRGALDVGALRTAVRELPARHERCARRSAPTALTLRVAATRRPLEVPLHDLAALPPEARAAELAAIAGRHVAEPFDLERGPLFRAELVRLAPNHHVLVFTATTSSATAGRTGCSSRTSAALYALATGARARAAAAGAVVRRLRRRAARAAAPRAPPNERWWLEQFADGVPGARAADRPAAARRCGPPAAGRDDHVLPPELLAGVQEARREARRQPVRDAARRLRRAAAPPDRAGRPRRRHPRRRPGRRRARRPGRPLRATCCRCAPAGARRAGSPTLRQGRRARRCSTPTSTRTSPSAAAAELPIARDPSRLPLDQRHLQHRPGAQRRSGQRCPALTLELRLESAHATRLRAVRQRRRRRRGGHAARVPVQHATCSTTRRCGAGSPRSRRCCAARSPTPTQPLGALPVLTDAERGSCWRRGTATEARLPARRAASRS